LEESAAKRVAVGWSYPTSVPEEALLAGADYMILDEGKSPLPMFVEAIGGRLWHFPAENPTGQQPPIPRFDLWESDCMTMSTQFCAVALQCEFCDIVLYGRKLEQKPSSAVGRVGLSLRVGVATRCFHGG